MKIHKRLGEILTEAKRISREQLRKALTQQSKEGGKIGQHLLSLGFIDEETLCLTLSKQLKIPIIPEEKFSRLNISPEILKRIPQHFAAKNFIFPIQFDEVKNSVSVAMVDPTDTEILKEIKIICQTDKVKRYLAQKSSILNAIENFYAKNKIPVKDEKTDTKIPKSKQKTKKTANLPENSETDFTGQSSLNPEMAANLIVSELNQEETALTSGKKTPTHQKKAKDPKIDSQPANLGKIQLKKNPTTIKIAQEDLATSPSIPMQAPAPVPPEQVYEGRELTDSNVSYKSHAVSVPSKNRVLIIDDQSTSLHAAEKILLSESYVVTPAQTVEEGIQSLSHGLFDLVLVKAKFSPHLERIRSSITSKNQRTQIRTYTNFANGILGSPIEYDELSGTLFALTDYLISLLERKDPAYRSYAHTIAKYSRLVAQRLNLPLKIIDETYLAAYMHDLWKYLDDEGQSEEKEQVKRQQLSEIFSNIHCAYPIGPIIDQIGEFYNGTGKPNQLKGEKIHIGARVISVIRAFEGMIRAKLVKDLKDITKVGKLLRKGAGKKFDPNCVEIFIQVLEGESFLEKVGVQPILDMKNSILLVDKDPRATSLLELRLINEGYSVKVSRDGQEAWRLIQSNPPTLILSDVVLPKIDGFNLCELVKGNEKTKSIPFFFVSSRSDDFNMTKGLEMGADDYQIKPVNVPFMITKIRKIFESQVKSDAEQTALKQKGVSGSLSQMGLVEIIQILGGGNKTAFIQIQSSEGGEAEIYMERGRIVATENGNLSGEEAFYDLMTWNEGSFSILPDQTTSHKNINNSNDYLLLEAMRRQDEANAVQANA